MKTKLLKRLRKIAREHVYFQCTERNLCKYIIVMDNTDCAAGFPGRRCYCGIDNGKLKYDVSHISTDHAFNEIDEQAIDCLQIVRNQFIKCLVNEYKAKRLLKIKHIETTLFCKEVERKNKWLRKW